MLCVMTQASCTGPALRVNCWTYDEEFRSVVSISLEVQKRPFKQTKGSIHALRQSGWIPAIVYGNQQDPQGISVCAKPFLKQLETPGIRARVFDLGQDIGLVLVKDMAFLPTKDTPIHIDFMRVKERVEVLVPLQLVNEDKSPGIKRGGVLNFVHHTLRISAPSSAIPQAIIADLTGLEIGQTLNLTHVSLPEGVQVLHLHAEETLLSVVAPSGLAESKG